MESLESGHLLRVRIFKTLHFGTPNAMLVFIIYNPGNEYTSYIQDTLFCPNEIQMCMIFPLKLGHRSNQDTFPLSPKDINI